MAKRLELNGLECYLLPQRAFYIAKYQMLLVSDWHLGKLKHFRAEGLFVPAPAIQEELARLDAILNEIPVKQVVFLGDLFHSKLNSDWHLFCQYLQGKTGISFSLTVGNHDILNDEDWHRAGLKLTDHILLPEGILLSHEPKAGLDGHLINIVGHVHPGCVIQTAGRQTFRLPCFHLHKQLLTLPAFGKYTGLHILPAHQEARIFAIVDQSILELPA